MANEGAYLDLTLRRGEDRPRPFIYRPRDRSLLPHDISGKAFVMKIQPQDASEIVYSAAPEISVTDAVNGEFTIAIPGSEVTSFQFQNAPYVVLMDGVRLLYGTLTIKYLYD